MITKKIKRAKTDSQQVGRKQQLGMDGEISHVCVCVHVCVHACVHVCVLASTAVGLVWKMNLSLQCVCVCMCMYACPMCRVCGTIQLADLKLVTW